MNAERSVVFHAESAALEGRLAIPAGAGAALVMCHPHPQDHFLAGAGDAIGRAVVEFLGCA